MTTKKLLLSLSVGFAVTYGFTIQANALNLDRGLASSFALNTYKHSLVLASADADGQKAKDMIEQMGDKAISFLSDGTMSMDQKEKEFRKLLRSSFDMETIGRFALGRNWKAASDAQKKEYQKLFENLVVEVYSARFNDYNGQKFEVASFQNTGDKDITVTSYIVPDTGSKVQVDWRVRNRNGQYKIVDVIIEGVSMAVTQRSDFSSVIQRGGGDVEVLLAHLRK